MNKFVVPSDRLAAEITQSASKQTYYTILFLADRDRVADAFRAYAYFRWLDDQVDDGSGSKPEKIALIQSQKDLLERSYRSEISIEILPEERMLVDLIRHDTEAKSGLQIYLRNMMDVMLFDARRRGHLISQAELTDYSRKLSIAVTEALYYFIGHNDPSPQHKARYFAVYAAHVIHMLRDALEDTRAGYFNFPCEVFDLHGISPLDVSHPAYREWVCGQVQLARAYFLTARECTAQVKNWRCRLAGFLYTARFEWMLRAIERDNYCLRREYPERKSLRAGLWMAWSALSAIFALPEIKAIPNKLTVQPARIEKR
jgi:phytoene/squalene synthetase